MLGLSRDLEDIGFGGGPYHSTMFQHTHNMLLKSSGAAQPNLAGTPVAAAAREAGETPAARGQRGRQRQQLEVLREQLQGLARRSLGHGLTPDVDGPQKGENQAVF